jgi:hypothetical protein
MLLKETEERIKRKAPRPEKTLIESKIYTTTN